MKKFILVFIYVLSSTLMYGQAGTRTFDLSAGALFPLGNLANNSIRDSSSGVAATGYHIQVSYNYQIYYNFGLGVDVEFNDAKYSMNKVMNDYENRPDDAKKEIESAEGWTFGGIYLRYYLHLLFLKTV